MPSFGLIKHQQHTIEVWFMRISHYETNPNLWDEILCQPTQTVINVINIAALIPIFDSVQQYSLWIYPDGPHVGHMNLVIGYLSISSCLDAQLDCAQGGLGCEQMFLFPNGLSKPICPLQDSWNSYPANVKWGAKQHCSVRRHVVHAHQCVDIEIVDYVLLNSLLRIKSYKCYLHRWRPFWKYEKYLWCTSRNHGELSATIYEVVCYS